MIGILVVLFVAFIYFLPSIIALGKDKKNGTAIAVLNLFLGWTLIGWVIALCWAVMYEEKEEKKTKK